MKKILIGLVLLTSTLSFAESVNTVTGEGAEAIHHLSRYCKDALANVESDSWVAETEYWDSRTQNYGYNYFVVKQRGIAWGGFVSLERIAVIRLTARYIKNPPQDRPAHEYTCDIEIISEEI